MSRFMQSLVYQCVSMWPQSFSASPSSVVTRGLGTVETWLTECVLRCGLEVLVLVYSLVAQERLLG